MGERGKGFKKMERTEAVDQSLTDSQARLGFPTYVGLVKKTSLTFLALAFFGGSFPEDPLPLGGFFKWGSRKRVDRVSP